ncbi:MAG: Mrp/NBP35 family ATP-binding protein [Anaerovibrio sp.]|nr:Mrp/NBP35 family ATP-binding protein [Anaerovibrio sp.]
MSEECNHNCGDCASAGSCESQAKNMKDALNPHSKVKKVIAVVSGKGGVGKSLVTGLMAVSMNREGFRTAIMDADITGPSIPKMFGVSDAIKVSEKGAMPAVSEKGIQMVSINLLVEKPDEPVVWRGPVISGAVKQFWHDMVWEDVDYMFIDMPPGTGDVPLTVFQSLPVDGIIIVTSPQELVSMIVAKAVRMANMMNVPILGVVENMAYFMCPNCQEKHFIFGDSHLQEIAAKYNLEVLAQIPMEPELAKECDAGRIEGFQGGWMEKAVEKVKSI